jgi:hypothetical protein
MSREIQEKIINLIEKAQKLALQLGIPNLMQPGQVKEMIIANLLGHNLIISKHGADACDAENSEILYEYLSCKEGGTGQLDRMYKEPPENRQNSLIRITRNHKIYFAVFYKNEQLKAKKIYEIETAVFLAEAMKKLDKSNSNHIGFSEKWVRENGIVVYPIEE